MTKLRRTKHNLKLWNRARHKDIETLTSLESNFNQRLLDVDNNPKNALLYDAIMNASSALK